MIGKLAYLMMALAVGYLIVGPGFLAGVAVGAAISFRAGQMHRGWMHARGIRQAHFAAISGRGR
jgi:hypothetical protein